MRSCVPAAGFTIYVFERAARPGTPTPSSPSGSCPRAATASGSTSQSPTEDEARILAEPFRFHELAIEDALKEIHTPKIESYGDYLYLILHGIDFSAAKHRFATHDVDFFLGEQFLVTVHDELLALARAHLRDVCPRNDFVLAEGPSRCCTASSTRWSTTTVPRSRSSRSGSTRWRSACSTSRPATTSARSSASSGTSPSLRRVVMPQRDVVGRLARREFPIISEALSYRFRDVYDHLVRLADEATLFQDRITSLLDAHLSFTSNRLNQVMKVLTIISTIFLPLTVLTGMYGMNVTLPHFPGGEPSQFWWIVGHHARHLGARCSGTSTATTTADRTDAASASSRRSSPTRSPPARSSNGRPRSSRSWSRTRSTPAPAASPSPSSSAARRWSGSRTTASGMSPADAQLALAAARHLKIATAHDLGRDPHPRVPRRGAAVDRLGVALRAADAASAAA